LSRGNVAGSTTTTSSPRSTAVIAAAIPAGPAPATRRSPLLPIAADATGPHQVAVYRTSRREKMAAATSVSPTAHRHAEMVAPRTARTSSDVWLRGTYGTHAM